MSSGRRLSSLHQSSGFPLASARWRTKPKRENRRIEGSADVAADRAARDDAVALALFRQQAEAGGDRRARACRASSGLPSTAISPASGRSTPAIRRSSSVRPAPTRPGDAEHLALAQLEARILHGRAAARGPHVEHDLVAWQSSCARRPPARGRPCGRRRRLSVVSVRTTSSTLRPSRRMVAVWQTRNTSSILCET